MSGPTAGGGHYLRWLLWRHGERPGPSGGDLIGMSNASDVAGFERHRQSLYRNLRLPRAA